MNILLKLFKNKLCLSLFFFPFLLLSHDKNEIDDFFNTHNEYKNEKIQERETALKKISNKYILTFFYFGEQTGSLEAAKYVQNLEIKYDWTTYAISLNNSLIDGFKNNKINNGIYDKFNEIHPYKNFKGPVLFLFNPKNQDIHWLVSGGSEFKELEERIYLRACIFGL